MPTLKISLPASRIWDRCSVNSFTTDCDMINWPVSIRYSGYDGSSDGFRSSQILMIADSGQRGGSEKAGNEQQRSKVHAHSVLWTVVNG